jgi:AcrR family transcriptional regulator
VSGARGQGDQGERYAFGRLPPGPHRLPRELVRENQRQRILLAALDVFSERGFAGATVQDLIRGAHVSRATFYEIFPDKEACAAALYEEILGGLRTSVAAALEETVGWSAQVRVAVSRTVELLAEDPRFAAVCAVEAPAGAPQVRSLHDRVVEELTSALRAGRNEAPRGEELPEILEPALIHGAIYLVGRSIARGLGPDAQSLIAELPELLLTPYRA